MVTGLFFILMRPSFSEPVFPPQFFFLGLFMIGYGGFMLFTQNFWGVLVLLVGLAFVFLRSGRQLHPAQARYRNCYGLFGFYVGVWSPLRPIKYVSLYREQHTQVKNVVSISSVSSEVVYLVALVDDADQKYVLGQMEDGALALQQAGMLAQRFEVCLHNFTDI